MFWAALKILEELRKIRKSQKRLETNFMTVLEELDLIKQTVEAQTTLINNVAADIDMLLQSNVDVDTIKAKLEEIKPTLVANTAALTATDEKVPPVNPPDPTA